MGVDFEGKVRKLGNSMAVIIPKEVLEQEGVREGDIIKLTIPLDGEQRKRALRRIIGISKGTPPFARENEDRVDRY